MKNFRTTVTYTLTLLVLCLFTILPLSAFSTSTNELITCKSTSESKMLLSGYSNLNNWSMDFNSFNSAGSFSIKNGELDEVNALQFDIATNSLKAENAQVDSLLYTVLANGKFNEISFKLTRQMVLPMMKMVHIIGDFTIGGVTRSISLQMNYEMDDNKNIKFTGTNTILLSDFINAETKDKLKAIKCNDQLTFALELNLQAKS